MPPQPSVDPSTRATTRPPRPLSGRRPSPLRDSRRPARTLAAVGYLAQLLDAGGQDAGDLHLRDAEEVRYLALEQLVPEAQLDHVPIALGQAVEQRVDGAGVLDLLVPVLLYNGDRT